jgi:hypothetical protein
VVYFERVHPLFPFLDRASFESTVFSSDLEQTLSSRKSFYCLYHTVLALGSQYDHERSFEPGTGRSWALFAVALGTFPDLLLQPDSLFVLQATTAMSIYALGVSCLAVEHVITSEASRRAQSLGSSKLPSRSVEAYKRTFWVLYAVEKMSSFHFGRCSVRFPSQWQH